MLRSVGLQNYSALFVRSACSACNLSDELEGALARAIIAKVQRGVRFENSHERYVAEIVTFGNHLCADEDIGFAFAE